MLGVSTDAGSVYSDSTDHYQVAKTTTAESDRGIIPAVSEAYKVSQVAVMARFNCFVVLSRVPL